MIIYKITLDENNKYVGRTSKTIARKRFGHRVCAKNISTYCSLYKRIRELEIEPTSIDLVVLETLTENDDADNKLAYWIKKEQPNLLECRADLYIDGNVTIKKTSMSCRCNIEQTKIIKGKPFIVTFD